MGLISRSSLGFFVNIEKESAVRPDYLDFTSLVSSTTIADGQTNTGNSFGATVTVSSNSRRITLDKNMWVRYTLSSPITVTATSTFSWGIDITDVGEIHGPGLLRTTDAENDALGMVANCILQAGTQSGLAYLDIIPYSAPGFNAYTIALSTYFSIGDVVDRVFFVNDIDASPYQARSQYRDVFFTP